MPRFQVAWYAHDDEPCSQSHKGYMAESMFLVEGRVIGVMRILMEPPCPIALFDSWDDATEAIMLLDNNEHEHGQFLIEPVPTNQSEIIQFNDYLKWCHQPENRFMFNWMEMTDTKLKEMGIV